MYQDIIKLLLGERGKPNREPRPPKKEEPLPPESREEAAIRQYLEGIQYGGDEDIPVPTPTPRPGSPDPMMTAGAGGGDNSAVIAQMIAGMDNPVEGEPGIPTPTPRPEREIPENPGGNWFKEGQDMPVDPSIPTTLRGRTRAGGNEDLLEQMMRARMGQ